MTEKKYLTRTLTSDLLRISNNDKVLLINGPRQIGKTTFLQHIAESGRKYVTFDNKTDLQFAKTDSKGFLETFAPPVIFDEIQYAPELFPCIKMLVDSSDARGQIWMTGSQQYNMMENVTESLAGRVIIIDMLGLSLYERDGLGEKQKAFLPSGNPQAILKKRNIPETFKLIWQGAFPDVIYRDEKSRKDFYDSYVRTYIERDVSKIINVSNEVAFITFLKIAAARTGQELNIANIAKDVGISQPTVKNWLSVLRASGIIYFLQPYFKNITKRLIKSAKMYFLDTGLAAYLAGWTTSEALETGISAGAFFETFVVSEILKSYYHNGETPQLYFFRDDKKHEIDLLIYKDGMFFPIEIKKHASPTRSDISAFEIFSKLEKVSYGCEICLTPNLQPLTPNVVAHSIWDI
ncbi:MAG: ATP-binding protein [Endomicrobium sp.]|jgi:predicted AAA+ superfamily ATPase|uniref:ATP-binding protein n=1 Tax=Candidatus Endomicrobiellum cubanum TaxID=3242325 RepID=UPI0028323B2E|nr:ATP-binding protein [Endomicrobium sp.]